MTDETSLNRMKWEKLTIGEKFALPSGKKFEKVNDEGYFFGVCNSKNLETGEIVWVDPDFDVTKL